MRNLLSIVILITVSQTGLRGYFISVLVGIDLMTRDLEILFIYLLVICITSNPRNEN